MLKKNVKQKHITNSIIRLPEKLLFVLFHNEYQFFELKYSFIKIFYLFALEHKLPLNGSLQQYVYDIKKFEQNVQWEYFYKTKKRITIIETRNMINYYLHNNLKQHNIMSKSLKKLDLDMKKIRIHLFKICKLNVPKNKIKINTLQKLYYQTSKNYHLLRVIHYIKNKYRRLLTKKNIFSFNELFSNLDSIPKDFTTMDSLSIIPYQNGIFIKSPIKLFNTKLKRYLNNYNFFNKYHPLSIKKSKMSFFLFVLVPLFACNDISLIACSIVGSTALA